MKAYDREYYQHWYHNPKTRVATAETTALKAHVAVSIAEYMLNRRIESVLDIGCGEGLWRAALPRMRPRVRYLGLEPSEYIVNKFGKARNIQFGSLGQLHKLKLKKRF